MKSTKRTVTLSMFAAIVVVLQVVATFIRFGSFPITLTLVPIIIAGALYGVGTGALMGFVFGVIVVIMVITGADPSGQVMFGVHPVVTVTACLLKGTLCGAASAAVYKWLRRKNLLLAGIAAAIVCPVVNTGILYAALMLFFETPFAAFLGAFTTANFIIELVINLVLAPTVVRIVEARRKQI